MYLRSIPLLCERVSHSLIERITESQTLRTKAQLHYQCSDQSWQLSTRSEEYRIDEQTFIHSTSHPIQCLYTTLCDQSLILRVCKTFEPILVAITAKESLRPCKIRTERHMNQYHGSRRAIYLYQTCCNLPRSFSVLALLLLLSIFSPVCHYILFSFTR